MYLSLRFEYHVLKFVADEMIKYRNLIEDGFIGKFDVLMSYLRRCYAKVHIPDVFQNTTLSDFKK